MTGEGMYLIRLPRRRTPNRAWKIPPRKMTRKTSSSIRGPWACARLPAMTEASRKVTTLRGAYISGWRSPSRRMVSGMKMAL
jgi:hypothetical protein